MSAAKKGPSALPAGTTVSEKVGDARQKVVTRDTGAYQAQKRLEKIHEIQKRLKSHEKG